MREEEVLGKEILSKVVKFDVVGAQAVRGRDTTDARKLVHVLVSRTMSAFPPRWLLSLET